MNLLSRVRDLEELTRAQADQLEGLAAVLEALAEATGLPAWQEIDGSLESPETWAARIREARK
jgi:hypothetical protein